MSNSIIPIDIQSENVQLEDILLDVTSSGIDFIVDTIEKASWASRKLLDARSRIEDRLTKAEEFTKRINLWVERANVEDFKTMESMESAIEPFALDEVLKQKKSKTLKLSGINISFRKTYSTVNFENKSMALNFCEENHPSVVETTKFMQDDKIRILLNTGSVVPGVRLIAGADKMHVIDQRTKEVGNTAGDIENDPEIDF